MWSTRKWQNVKMTLIFRFILFKEIRFSIFSFLCRSHIIMSFVKTYTCVYYFKIALFKKNNRRRVHLKRIEYFRCRVENETETDGNMLYRYCFPLSCRNRKWNRNPRKRIWKRKPSDMNTERIRSGYVTKTNICHNTMRHDALVCRPKYTHKVKDNKNKI
jgi:hypothetical protein